MSALGILGPQNFRAISLGLRDSDSRVRQAASDTILRNFSAQEIVEEFKGRDSHSISLVCSLKEINYSRQLTEELHTMIG